MSAIRLLCELTAQCNTSTLHIRTSLIVIHRAQLDIIFAMVDGTLSSNRARNDFVVDF